MSKILKGFLSTVRNSLGISKVLKDVVSILDMKNNKINSRLNFVVKENTLSKSKRSQIWVETVIYTLIGLAVIAIILVTAVPRIDKLKERAIIEQTISSMNSLNKKILETEQTAGNVRVVDFRISKGQLEINSTGDMMTYTLEDAKLEMSEPGIEIEQGDVILKTESVGSKFKITLKMEYENIDLTYADKEETRILHAGATSYRINIENTGIINGGKRNINIDVI